MILLYAFQVALFASFSRENSALLYSVFFVPTRQQGLINIHIKE